MSKGDVIGQKRRHREQQAERRRAARQEERALEREAEADADPRDRRCSVCGEVKPRAEFQRDRTKPGGLLHGSILERESPGDQGRRHTSALPSPSNGAATFAWDGAADGKWRAVQTPFTIPILSEWRAVKAQVFGTDTVEPSDIGIAVGFVDANGKHWTRFVNGKLMRVDLLDVWKGKRDKERK
jgi:hypothetical protein